MAADQMPGFLRDYRAIAQQRPDSILFYRMGDFYEVFENVEFVAEALDLTITSRSRCKMVGVPFHSIESAVAALIRRGKQVAIAEKPSSGLYDTRFVSRNIDRVYLPATAESNEDSNVEL